jgi:hypothetical protein
MKDVKIIRDKGNAAREILPTADKKIVDTIIIGGRGLVLLPENFC